MSGSLYDFPQYYDLLFRKDAEDEATFIQAAWKSFGSGALRRLLEPACGSGRLVIELANRGLHVTGFDICDPAVSFLKDQLQRKRLPAEVLSADMTDFRIGAAFDLAYCTLNTFRHLTTEADAHRHLQCVADHLRAGGLYILAFHLFPPGTDEQCVEQLSVQSGKTRVDFELRVLNFCRRKRIEQVRLQMDVQSPKHHINTRSEFPMRIYRAAQFESLLRKVPDFDLLETFDFDFDIEFPRDLDDDLADAVFILRKE